MSNAIDTQAIERCKSITDPMVSVGVLSYNQARYIRSALDSIICQEVNFNYEIVVADDFSTDGTRDILLEYAKKFPNVIRLILQEENVGLVENSKCLKRACRGRYRATNDGDDFWIDTDRLQRQVDFLENNPEYVAVCADLVSADDNGNLCPFPWGGKQDTYRLGDCDYHIEDFEQWKIPSHSGAWLAYNIFAVIDHVYLDQYESYAFPGDRKTPLYTMLYGRIKILPEPVMVRRLLRNSKTSHISSFKDLSAPVRVFNWAKEAQKMDDEFLHIGLDMSCTLDRMFLSTFREFMLVPSKAHLKACITIFRNSDRKLHHFLLFHQRMGEKILKKFKKDGFFHCIVGVFKYCIKAIKGVLSKK